MLSKLRREKRTVTNFQHMDLRIAAKQALEALVTAEEAAGAPYTRAGAGGKVLGVLIGQHLCPACAEAEALLEEATWNHSNLFLPGLLPEC